MPRPLFPHPSRATLRRVAVAAALTTAAAAVHAASYLEEFSGGLNPALWTMDDADNGWFVDDGRLVFVRANSAAALLTFTPLLQGDFDVRMDYDVSAWSSTYGGGDRFGLGVTPVGDEPAFGSGIGYAQEQYLYAAAAGACCKFGPFAPLVDGGTVRLSRSGDRLALQYLDAGNWITLDETTETRDVRLTLSSYIHNGFVPGATYAVDNLSIVADGFLAPIPEPGTGAMLAAGMAALGWMARRRRLGAA
ncbi:MAG: PEP-CTERM sorting domain-containing protein [Rubrivivax sp.]|jgi:hypothetical protein|nr:PEP-CTERM sorting domain-containing protein [Rubrivivax sp.]